MVIMARRRRYSLVFAVEVKQHRRSIEAKHHLLIREAIEEQLFDQPDVETRNRKPLVQAASFDSTWEIRFGPDNRFRVLYDIDQEDREVHVLAVGVKVGHRLVVGGEEIEL